MLYSTRTQQSPSTSLRWPDGAGALTDSGIPPRLEALEAKHAEVAAKTTGVTISLKCFGVLVQVTLALVASKMMQCSACTIFNPAGSPFGTDAGCILARTQR
jgi:hypothetical protein